MIIINADDWGRSRIDTDAALSCWRSGRVTSVSAMVFMEDSRRAAELAGDEGIDVGLHLNFSQAFTGRVPAGTLQKHHDRIVRFLALGKYAQIFYNPVLRREFRHDFRAQLEEFQRLYGKDPSHFDGHHHLHLSSNLLLDRLIPKGAKVRRNFSFWPGEKDLLNRSYRRVVDALLARRFVLTDFFFALSQCLRVDRLERIATLARAATVELMTHPAKTSERACLMSEAYRAMLGGLKTGAYSSLRK